MATHSSAKKRRMGAAPVSVSVCLPVHNCEQYLDDCFASILGTYSLSRHTHDRQLTLDPATLLPFMAPDCRC